MMKIRIAKKILHYNLNARVNEHQRKRFQELRPPYWRINEPNGTMSKVYPSWHDIDIISRANTRLRRWLKNK